MKKHHFSFWSRLLLSFFLLIPQGMAAYAEEQTPEEAVFAETEEISEEAAGEEDPAGTLLTDEDDTAGEEASEEAVPEPIEETEGEEEIPEAEEAAEETVPVEDTGGPETVETVPEETETEEELPVLAEEETGTEEPAEEEFYEQADISSFVLQEGGFVPAADDSVSVFFSDDALGLPDSTAAELEKRVVAAAGSWKDSVQVTDLKIPLSAAGSAYYYVINNNPQLFYVDGTRADYYVDKDKKYVTKYLITYDRAYGRKDVDAFNARVSEILSEVNYTWNDEQKALYLHDVLVIDNTYDESLSRFNAYNALVERTSVCEGYALAYKYLLNQAGVEADVISSFRMGHAWNSAVIGGKTYYIDTTWDDPTGTYLMYCGHQNFLLSRDEMIETDHTMDDWVNTKGEEVYDTVALETYPGAYWTECETRIPAVRVLWAYTVNSKDIYVHDYSAGTDRLLTDALHGDWHVPGRPSYYTSNYISLDVYGDLFLASQEDTVYSISTSGSVREIGTITDEEMNTGRIYGIQTEGNKVRYDLYTMPDRSDLMASGYLPIFDEADLIHVSGITLDSEQSRLAPGEVVSLTASVYPEDASDRRLTWQSSDPAVAAVDHAGNIAAAGMGTAVITVRSVSDPDVFAQHTVSVVIRPETVTVTPVSLTLSQGWTAQLSYTVTPGNADVASAEWQSDDPGTASVDENGLVTAVRTGQTVIRLTVNGGEASASVPVEVIYVPVSGIRILNKTEYIPLGKEIQLRYAIEPEDASDRSVTFVSDHPEAVSVSETGVIRGVDDGTAQITVSAGDGAFSDSFTVGVVPDNIYPGEMQKEFEYTGKAIRPAVELYDAGRLLKAGTDYTVSYKNNTKAGTASVILTMKGNYTGTKTLYFEILPVSLQDERVTADALTVQETGKTLTPVPVLYFEAKKLVKGTDYTVTKYTMNGADWDRKSPGEVTLTLTGRGNYAGTKDVTAWVVPKDAQLTALSKVKVTAKSVSYQKLSGDDFAGEIIPCLTVKNGKNTLVYDRDYIVSEIPAEYRRTGTLKFTIEGTGKYSGKKTVSVKVTGISLTDKKMKNAGTGTYVYNGKAQKLADSFSLVYNGTPLEEEDYEILEDTYQNNVNAGSASVKIAGRRGFTGTRTVKFTIRPDTESITAEDVSCETSVPFAKGGAKAEIRVFDGELGLLKAGTDYTVKYSANTKTGTGKATLTFKGNFKGTAAQKVSFEIVPKDIGKTALTAKDVVYSSAAGKYRSTPSLKDTDGKAMKAGTDYLKTCVYELKNDDGTYTPLGAKDKVPAGSAVRVTVTGKGNYTGTVSGEYRILAKGTDISKAVFTIASQEYTGEAVTLDGSAFTKAVINKTAPLTLGQDFEIVRYSNNVKKGTASVTLHGINSYGGYKTVKFRITGKKLSLHWLDGYRSLTISGFNATYFNQADVTIEFQKAKLEKGTFILLGMDLEEYLITDVNIIHVKPDSTVRITDALNGGSTGVWTVILSEGDYYDSPAGTTITSGNVSGWPVHVVNDTTFIGMYYLKLKDTAADTITEYYIVIDS